VAVVLAGIGLAVIGLALPAAMAAAPAPAIAPLQPSANPGSTVTVTGSNAFWSSCVIEFAGRVEPGSQCSVNPNSGALIASLVVPPATRPATYPITACQVSCQPTRVVPNPAAVAVRPQTATTRIAVRATPVTVPSLRGLTADEALAALHKVVLLGGYAAVANGRVVTQTPVAGTVVAPHSRVHFVLALWVVVPQLKGLDVGHVRAALGPNLVLADATGTGVVASQDPAAGTQVPVGTPVTVALQVVAPVLTTVPDFTGDTKADAAKLAAGAKLAFGWSGADAGKVTKKSVPAGSSVPIGTSVALTASVKAAWLTSKDTWALALAGAAVVVLVAAVLLARARRIRRARNGRRWCRDHAHLTMTGSTVVEFVPRSDATFAVPSVELVTRDTRVRSTVLEEVSR
jgi:beta-lactam-binding protein with PASTA domain